MNYDNKYVILFANMKEQVESAPTFFSLYLETLATALELNEVEHGYLKLRLSEQKFATEDLLNFKSGFGYKVKNFLDQIWTDAGFHLENIRDVENGIEVIEGPCTDAEVDEVYSQEVIDAFDFFDNFLVDEKRLERLKNFLQGYRIEDISSVETGYIEE